MNNPKLAFQVFLAFFVGGISLSSALLTALRVIDVQLSGNSAVALVAILFALQLAASGYVTLFVARDAQKAVRMAKLQAQLTRLNGLKNEIKSENEEIEGENPLDTQKRLKSKLKRLRRVLRDQEAVITEMAMLQASA